MSQLARPGKTANDAFNALETVGMKYDLTAVDLTAMDVIG